ncbi:MAG: ABC transporter ATP-binding protein [Pyrinomonadaceae bacterium]
MLEGQGISVGYNGCEVVAPVSFVVSAGEIVVVLGANGAGKTTLLRALNGSLPVMQGEILLAGENLKTLSRRNIARRVTVVAQETETRFPVTVLEFVLSGRFASSGSLSWETKNDLETARNALIEADLANFEKRLINQLSGGERQRAVFARALATEARILLLDEPTANLDLAHQVSLLKLVRQKCDALKYCAVVITHDLNLAAEFADSILLLKHGKLIAAGSPERVLTNLNLRETFGVEVLLDAHPASGKTRVTTIYQ